MERKMSSPSSKPSRGAVLTVFAILFVVLAISNFSKPFHLDSRAGFVFFGVKTSGIANDILGPAFGVWLPFMRSGSGGCGDGRCRLATRMRHT